MKHILPKGFIPVMLTPFENNGEVDYYGLSRLTSFYINAGASGLFANCLSSEMYELSMNERLSVIEHVVQNVAGEVPVVATGNFGSNLQQQADFVKRVYDKGVQAVILITSLLVDAEESAAVLEERVFKMLDLTSDIPLGFYECPVPYKRVLSPEQLGRFVKTGRIIYYKDTCLNINNVSDKLKLTGGYSFGLYDAYIEHAVLSLRAGTSGLSCIQGNFFPELIVWMCKNYKNSDKEEELMEVQRFFSKSMHVMHHVYPVVAKYFLQQRGIKIDTISRRQVGVYTDYTSLELDRLQTRYESLVNMLGWELND